MRSIKKSVHKLFTQNLILGLLDMGFEEQKRLWGDGAEYVKNTKAGKLTLYPDHPIIIEGQRWKCFGLTCFGRFEEVNKAKKIVDCGLSGKWNFHFGNGDEEYARNCVENILCNVKKLL